MKILAASIAVVGLISSPALAQTNVKQSTTTKEVHATNVPVTHHHATKKHHEAHCGCPPSHMTSHHVKATVKTTTTKG